MSSPGSLRVWFGIVLLLAAALAGCGGGSSDREPGVPPHLTPEPWLSFLHPVSGRPLASGADFEIPDSVRPGRPMQPLTLPAARSNPESGPTIAYALEHPAWPPGLRFEPATRTLSGTLGGAQSHPPSYRLAYRASAPGHRDAHLTVILHLEDEDSVDPGLSPPLFFPAADGTPLDDRAPPLSLGTFVQGEPIPALPALPEARGARSGTRIAYDLTRVGADPGTGGLPRGLDFDPVLRTLRGTIEDPRWPAGTHRLDYVASAPGHVEARRRVRFDLEDPLRLRGPPPDPFSFPVGAFTREPLPQATGGAPPYRYSLEQCPLDWIELVGAELIADPQPGHAGETRLCRYRAEDSAGGFVEITLEVSAVGGAGGPLALDPAHLARLESDGNALGFPVGAFTRRELPQATGGAPPYRYSLEPCTLDWIELVGTELAASPRPDQAGEARLCRYRVTDATGAFVEITLEVSAVGGAGGTLALDPAHLARLESDDSSLEFPVGALTRRELPRATGGAPPYRYSLEQCPLDWIELVGAVLAASPRPDQAGEARLCRYRATDATGAFVEITLLVSAVAGAGGTLALDAAHVARLESDDGSLEFPVGALTRRELPQAAGGSPPYRYSLEQCPLDWIELVGTELAASPRPDQAGEARLCRYRVTDATGAFVDLTLEISAVTGTGRPLAFEAAGGGPAVDAPSHAFRVDTFTRRELPRATGGSPPYRYSLEQCPIDWLELVGTELAASPRAEHAGEERLCRYRVTDETGAFLEITLEISAVTGTGGPLAFEPAQVDRLERDDDALAFPVGAFTQRGLPQATGGAPPYRYSLEQCPLVWIELVGTELAANPQREHGKEERLCRYRATDAAGGFVELLLRVSAVAGEDLVLRFEEAQLAPFESDDEVAFQVGEFTRRSLPEAAGGVPPYRYSLEQCPLDWLELVGTELAASPQPEHEGEERLCRYRVSDADGAFEDLVLNVSATPVPRDAFQFENRHIVDRDVPVGSAIEEIDLPRAVNARGTVQYELNRELPPGLRFREPFASTGSPGIVGTPRAISLLTRYCLHATDTHPSYENGMAVAAPRCFHLRTVGHSVPRFTVNLGSVREVLLFSELISTTVRDDEGGGDPDYDIGDTVPQPVGAVAVQLPVAFLPPSWDGDATYSVVPDPDPFTFDGDHGTRPRLLTSPAATFPPYHPLPTPVVYTYGVRREADSALFAAAICFELGHRIDTQRVPASSDTERVWRETWLTVTFRDEAVRTSTGEYLCHPNPRGDDDPTRSPTQSNPVHDALGMVHARRAVRLAHDLIAERVREASPGGEGAAFHSHADLAWLRGRSGGFSWSGTGESLLAGADLVRPGGALRLGLVAGFHRTALDYRAEARHLQALYSEGEHATEIVAAHPYAAWRFAAGSLVWGSVGAGAGSLWFEDDAPPFDERRRSDLALHSAALGFHHPLTSSPLGTFSFSGLAERIALRIEGDEREHGIRPRNLHGSDVALRLDWRRRTAVADPSIVPSFSFGIRRQAGDGAADSFVDVAGALAYRPLSNPLAFDFAASTLVGIAGNDSGAWDLRASARYDPRAGSRGLELSLRSALGASSDESRVAYGLASELSYGIFGGVFGSTVRPYLGASALAGASGVRRTAGLRLRDEPDYRLSLETWEHAGSDAAGLNLRLHRVWP